MTSDFKLRGIVFDMDGVVIDSHPAHRFAWKSFLQSAGRQTSDEELDFILDGRKREEILRYFFGELPPERMLEYGNRKDEMLRKNGDSVRPIPGVADFLSQLSGMGVSAALATSAGRQRTYGTLEQLNLLHCFAAIVTGDEVALGKPDPAIYRLAADRMGERPEHLLAVEDAVSGVRSARSAGMRCIGVSTVQRASLLRKAGASLIIPDFRGLSFGYIEKCFDAREEQAIAVFPILESPAD